ncbi:MAG TPA: hypothetical protein VGR55_07440 [Candidatus Acidoferrum sp.]|nr:hypothetical protein [Candidatus Acidoferrum sp.]
MKCWKFLFALTLVPWAFSASTKDPDCSEGWATPMTFAQLKNAGITDNDKIDFSKTKTTRLASEKIGKDLYRQVYHVQLTERSGKLIEAIAVHNASQEDCSESGVEVFLVSQHLNAERK